MKNLRKQYEFSPASVLRDWLRHDRLICLHGESVRLDSWVKSANFVYPAFFGHFTGLVYAAHLGCFARCVAILLGLDISVSAARCGLNN